jgi:hypothetical protein
MPFWSLSVLHMETTFSLFALGHGGTPAWCSTTGWRDSQSGGPRAGCAVRKVGWCACPVRDAVACGVAQLARGPDIAGWCPHPTGVACRLIAARTRAAQNGIRLHPARAGPCVDDPGTPEPPKRPCPPRIRKAARHRPVSIPTLAAGRRWPAQGARISPVAGLADPPVRTSRRAPVQADPAASGTRRCTASSIVPPHVTADTRRPSSRLDRHVDDPSGDGSATMMARGWRVWMKWR